MLPQADFDLTTHAFNGGRTNEADKNLRVHFNNFPQIDQDASTKEGRPIYKEVPYITIMIPGERDVVHRAAWQKDFDRFPLQWAAYLNKQNQDQASGTPLKLLPWMTAAQVKELEFFNCYTVEQLANLSDGRSQNFMGIQSLKQRAKDFLVSAKDAAPLLTIRAEIEKKDSELAAAMNALNEQAKRIKALEDALTKK